MAEENQEQSLYDFFENEVNHHNNNEKYIVSFNIGTYGSIEQELNDEWLDKLAPYIFDDNYTKVFYYIDCEYRKINIKDFIENLTQKILSFYSKNINTDFYFDNVYKTDYVEVVYNSMYSILVKKIDINLPTSYNYSDVFTNAFNNQLCLSRTFGSVPILPVWDVFYKLLLHFKTVNSLIYINNYACTNTNLYIDNGTPRPTFVKAYMGSYLEYFSELGYILRYLCRDGGSYKRILFRKQPYEEHKTTIFPLEEFKQFDYELKEEWDRMTCF